MNSAIAIGEVVYANLYGSFSEVVEVHSYTTKLIKAGYPVHAYRYDPIKKVFTIHTQYTIKLFASNEIVLVSSNSVERLTLSDMIRYISTNG